jgi:hypothetical protein
VSACVSADDEQVEPAVVVDVGNGSIDSTCRERETDCR